MAGSYRRHTISNGRYMTGQELLDALYAAGAIPETAIGVTIRANVDGIVTFDCEYLADGPAMRKLVANVFPAKPEEPSAP